MVHPPPLPAAVAAALTRVGRDLARAPVAVRRRAVLRVGQPGAAAPAFEVRAGEALDHALRTDVAAALLHRSRPVGSAAAEAPMAWLTRDGTREVEDADLAWRAAVHAAAGEAGRVVTFAVVTPAGWWLPGHDDEGSVPGVR